MENIKGQVGLNRIVLVVGVLVVIGVLFTYGGLFVGNIQEINQKIASIVNETRDIDENPVTLNGTINNGDCSITTIEAYNETGGELIATTEYNATGCDVVIAFGGSDYNSTGFNFTYSYTFNRENFYNITSQGTKSFSNFSDFYVIMGIIVMAIVLVGLLFFFKEVM